MTGTDAESPVKSPVSANDRVARETILATRADALFAMRELIKMAREDGQLLLAMHMQAVLADAESADELRKLLVVLSALLDRAQEVIEFDPKGDKGPFLQSIKNALVLCAEKVSSSVPAQVSPLPLPPS